MLSDQSPYFLNTEGHCLFCLKSITFASKSKSLEAGATVDEKLEAVSLHLTCHFLKVDFKRLYSVASTVLPPEYISALEKAELKGTMCQECHQLVSKLAKICLSIEALQKMSGICMERIHGKIKESSENKIVSDNFESKMTSDPQRIISYGIVGELRKELSGQCSQRISAIGKDAVKTSLAEVPVLPANEDRSGSKVAAIPVIDLSDTEDEVQAPQSSVQQVDIETFMEIDKIKSEPNEFIQPETNPLEPGPEESISALKFLPSSAPTTPSRRKIKCEICKRRFETYNDFIVHMKQDHYKKYHACKLCGVFFKTIASRDLHLDTCFKNNEGENTPIP